MECCPWFSKGWKFLAHIGTTLPESGPAGSSLAAAGADTDRRPARGTRPGAQPGPGTHAAQPDPIRRPPDPVDRRVGAAGAGCGLRGLAADEADRADHEPQFLRHLVD